MSTTAAMDVCYSSCASDSRGRSTDSDGLFNMRPQLPDHVKNGVTVKLRFKGNIFITKQCSVCSQDVKVGQRGRQRMSCIHKKVHQQPEIVRSGKGNAVFGEECLEE